MCAPKTEYQLTNSIAEHYFEVVNNMCLHVSNVNKSFEHSQLRT